MAVPRYFLLGRRNAAPLISAPIGARFFGSGLDGKEGHMSLVKRIAIAVGSLLALALAGGAHWKIP